MTFESFNLQACPISRQIEQWLTQFALHQAVHEHCLIVLRAMPEPARRDLMEDAAFVLYDYEPGAVMRVPVRLSGVGLGTGSRSVVLKRTLCRRPPGFARYVIAHEFAHAHLRNAGRWRGEDPEDAADALASAWGFPKP